MAAQWVDPDREIELDEGEELANLAEVEQKQEPKQEAKPEPKSGEEELPDKYRGKSVAEIARMHQEAEKLLGKQSGEVGELRRAFDDFVKGQAQKAPEQKKPRDPVDFFTDPEEAIRQVIAESPELKDTQQLKQELQRMKAAETFRAQHPDAPEIMANPKFAEWIKGSNYRLRLAQKADKYDIDAADELFTSWKEAQKTVKAATEIERMANKSEVKKAATGSTRSNPDGVGKKIYRRADIIKLMREDPKRYEALQPEIMAAYADGRVR